MKVLIVNRYMGMYGGAETVVKELAWHLQYMGVKTAVLTLNISEEVAALCKGLEIITPAHMLPYKFRSVDVISALGIIKEIKLLRALIGRYAAGFDLINAHNFPAHWASSGMKKPIVWMCNEIPDFYNNPGLGWPMKMLRAFGTVVDRHIVNTYIRTICVADEYNARQVDNRYQRKDAKIINYGIECDFFAQGDQQKINEIRINNEEGLVLLQVGMLSPEKNQLKSIQALEQLQKEFPGIRLVLAGRPQQPYESILRKYVDEKGLNDRVVFAGHITKAQVRGLYHSCKVALFPVKTQGGWLAPFEALCAGKPVIVSSTMGAASVIKREKLGIVSDDLVGSIRAVLSAYSVYAHMASCAREWVRSHLTWERFSREMYSVFSQALS